MSIREILTLVEQGTLSAEQAEQRIAEQTISRMQFATLDLDRQRRRGRPEAVYCSGKTAEQIIAITERIAAAGQTVLLTRLDDDKAQQVVAGLDDPRLVYTELARMAVLQTQPPKVRKGVVAVLAAGTSDLPVAEEAALTAAAYGSPVERAYDVGVAGLHRLLAKEELLRRATVVIVVAGMEGALPSVVSGLVTAPVIAVPVSVGYGVSAGGYAALLTMLSTCSPGVAVVNIDNGFGAGYLADQICSLGGETD